MAVSNLTNCPDREFQYILIVANSARMLAQAAQKVGFKALVIDCYGDLDTQSYAEEIQQIPSLAKQYLLPAIDYFIAQYAVTYMVYGSGFETYLDSLACIGERLLVLGNPAEIFSQFQDKPKFFSLLKTLQVPYPEVSFQLPEQDMGWLVKPVQGQGGVGIRRYTSGEATESSAYWQKYQLGMPHSVLFLADGKRNQIVGFNRQWTVFLNNRYEFIFSGIVNSTELSDKQKNQISGWLDKLVPALSLKGLNSLDFIQSGETNYALEINPRPPASMHLYDADLLVRHIKACQGELLDYAYVQQGYSGYQTVYAQQNVKIPDGFAWPEGTVDLPTGGSLISMAEPICSIIKHGKEPHAVLEQLQAKQAFIINQLNRFQSHGI
jgi:predicted ATP-grasp superfamily ATP-dependent carboligase